MSMVPVAKIAPGVRLDGLDVFLEKFQIIPARPSRYVGALKPILPLLLQPSRL